MLHLPVNNYEISQTYSAKASRRGEVISSGRKHHIETLHSGIFHTNIINQLLNLLVCVKEVHS
jgi:hypothetical protein